MPAFLAGHLLMGQLLRDSDRYVYSGDTPKELGGFNPTQLWLSEEPLALWFSDSLSPGCLVAG